MNAEALMMKPFQQQTYYELLDVPVTASTEEIQVAFERSIEMYAPDSVAIYALDEPALADKLRARLKEAAEILTDPDLRAEYDRTLGLPPRTVSAGLPREEAEDRTGQLAMAEVIASDGNLHSTHPELAVSYVQERPEESGGSAGEVAPAASPEAPGPRDEPRASHSARALETAPQLAQETAIATAEAAMAQVASRARERPRPLEIPPDAEFNGELLRRVRESKGLSLQQVADRTRISSRHLENVEADRYAALPAPVYLRGILTSLAREYGLDGLRVARSYMALAEVGKG